MKIILNVARELLLEPDMLNRWHPCEAVKLEELENGEFMLWITSNYEEVRAADERLQSAVAVPDE